jgi:type IV secretory pathway VirB3-like protein
MTEAYEIEIDSLAALICIDANTLLGIPLFFILHLVMAKISVKEPNFFYIWSKALIKTSPVLNSAFWGKTNSYQPW